MSRLNTVKYEEATGQARELLDAVKTKLGRTPNIMCVMANAPSVLQAYLGFSGALQEGVLSPTLRERIALAVSEVNGCGYCVDAHTAIGKMAGLDDQALMDSRKGTAADPKEDAAVKFSLKLVEKRGWADDADVEALRTAGYGDAEIAEITANVALNLFTNYFNHVADTKSDFPKAPDLA